MSQKTHKSILMELLAQNMCPHAPVVESSLIGGAPHIPIYESKITIKGWQSVGGKTIPSCTGSGQGRSKKISEQEAAAEVLSELKKVPGLCWPSFSLTDNASQSSVLYSMPANRNAPLLLEAAPTETVTLEDLDASIKALIKAMAELSSKLSEFASQNKSETSSGRNRRGL